MTHINAITLEADDTAAAKDFYAALGLDERIHVRDADTPSEGFRGFVLSLVMAQPGDVDAVIADALGAGAQLVKPARKSFWGYGGAFRAPDGALWKIATAAKKDSGPARRTFDQLVLLIGATDMGATKQFYVDRGLTLGKSFLNKYAEYEAAPDSIKLALYGHTALAKDVDVSPEGGGAHRITISSDAGAFTDPDGFAWQPA
jgi:catechol 2,3-dioxygenase-like lactoylglutathione lyase family enzyme